MTTDTDICNRALSEAGTRTRISALTDPTTAGRECALWYDISRKQLLRSAPWAFARRMNALSLISTLSDSNSPYPFLCKYAYPSDCLKFRYVIPPYSNSNSPIAPQVGIGLAGPVGYAPSRANRYLINEDVEVISSQPVLTKTILSNVEGAIGVYTMDVTNPDRFDVLFEGALTSLLAWRLVIPLTGNVGMRQDFQRAAESAVLTARAADANESIPSSDHTPDWIAGRGYAPLQIGTTWGSWNDGYDSMNWGM